MGNQSRNDRGQRRGDARRRAIGSIPGTVGPRVPPAVAAMIGGPSSPRPNSKPREGGSPLQERHDQTIETIKALQGVLAQLNAKAEEVKQQLLKAIGAKEVLEDLMRDDLTPVESDHGESSEEDENGGGEGDEGFEVGEDVNGEEDVKRPLVVEGVEGVEGVEPGGSE